MDLFDAIKGRRSCRQFENKPVEEEIEETLDLEKQKKFEEIMKDEFTLFGEEETLDSEIKEQNKIEETTMPVNETPTDECEKPKLNLSDENPFKRFSKEYKKED